MSGHYREGGRSSGVAIKRGSTVIGFSTEGMWNKINLDQQLEPKWTKQTNCLEYMKLRYFSTFRDTILKLLAPVPWSVCYLLHSFGVHLDLGVLCVQGLGYVACFESTSSILCSNSTMYTMLWCHRTLGCGQGVQQGVLRQMSSVSGYYDMRAISRSADLNHAPLIPGSFISQFDLLYELC